VNIGAGTIDGSYAKPLKGETSIVMQQSTRRKHKIYDGDDMLTEQARLKG